MDAADLISIPMRHWPGLNVAARIRFDANDWARCGDRRCINVPLTKTDQTA